MPQGQFKLETRIGSLFNCSLIPSSQANAPAIWPNPVQQMGLRAPGTLVDKLAQCEVGVTAPDKGVTQNGNWVTNWVWGHSFFKIRCTA